MLRSLSKLLLVVAISLFPMKSYSALTEEAKIDNADTSKPATIKIKLASDSSGNLLEFRGAYNVTDMKTKKTVSAGLKGKRFYLYPHKEGIKWGEDFLDIYQLRITPTNSETSFLVDGVQYKGSLEVFHIDGKLILINDIDVEHYLKSLLTPNFSKDILPVVMDAISIVARTNAYYHILHNKDAFWHLDAEDVGYKGHGVTSFNENVERSIDTTQFLVMTFEKKPFATTWSENCAGKTASYQSIFRKKVQAPNGIKSDFAQRARNDSHWSFSIDKSNLAKIAQTNRVTGLDLYIDSNSEKVYAIRVQDGSHCKEIDYFHLREGLGRTNLLSNDFTVSIQDNTIIFDGYGEGCSVGLCIYSATQMAKRGDSAPEILGTFYPFSHIEQIKSLPERSSKHTAFSDPMPLDQIKG